MKKALQTVLSVTLALLMTVSVFASSSEAPGTEPPPEDLWDGVWDGQSDGGPETPPEEWKIESDEQGESRIVFVSRADGKRISVALDRPDEAAIWAASYDGNDKTLEIQPVADNQVTVAEAAQTVKLFALGEEEIPLGDASVASFEEEDAQSGVQEAPPEGVAALDDGMMSVDGLGSWLSNNARYNIVSALDTTYAVDLNGNYTYNGSNIQLYKSNWSMAQDFKIQYVKSQYGQNWYKIIHTQSGKVLDVNASNWNPNTGNNVILYPYHGGNNQLWSFQRSGSGYRIQSLYDTRFYLDARGGVAGNYVNVWVYRQNSSRAQLWYLDKVTDYQIRFVDGNDWPISRLYISPGSNTSVKFQFRGANIQAVNAYNSPAYSRRNGFYNIYWPSSAGETGYGWLRLYKPSGDNRSCQLYLRLKARNAFQDTAALYLP